MRFGRGLVAAALIAPLTLVGVTGSLAAPRQSDLEAARAELAALERDFELAVESYNLAHERLTSLQAEIAANELVVERLGKRMQTEEAEAVAIAAELYKGGPTSAINAVLTSESIAEIENRVTYLQSSQEAQAEVFERLAVNRRTLDAKLRRLEVARAEAMDTQERLDGLTTTIEAKVADQQDEIADLNAAIERAEARAAARAEAAAEAAVRAAQAAQAPPAAPLLPSAPARPAPAPNPGAQTAVDAALSQLGKPYQWGAAGPSSYDCSGLTMWAWAHAGVALPHSSQAQYAGTPRVAQSAWQPGDLLFFGSPIHHVGMYIGNGQMVEAPYTGQVVRVVSAMRSDYVGAGRPG